MPNGDFETGGSQFKKSISQKLCWMSTPKLVKTEKFDRNGNLFTSSFFSSKGDFGHGSSTADAD